MRSNSNISLRLNPEGNWPQVDPSAYIDPTAQLIGNVHIGPRVYIGPLTVIRADEADSSLEVAPIEIGPECNVQDGVIIHASGGTQVTVGQQTLLAHGCTIHGPCTIGKGCFIGFRAVIYNATLGDRVFVGTGAIVQGVDLGASALVPPAVRVLSRENVVSLVSTTGPTECEFMERVVTANLALTEGYIRLDGQKENGRVACSDI